MSELKYKLVHNKMIPLTDGEIKQMEDAQKLDAIKRVEKERKKSLRKECFIALKSKLNINDEEADILIKGV